MAPKSPSEEASGLPRDVVPAVDIIDEKYKPGQFVNVIGIVHKALPPMVTKSKQWKSEVEIYDFSTQYDTELRLVFNIFQNPGTNVLEDIHPGDVIVLLKAKVQAYAQSFSLLSNHSTACLLFAADKMPPPREDPSPALRITSSKRQLFKPLLQFVSTIFHQIDKERLPTEQEIATIKVQSTNIHDKFTELKDVQDKRFHDLTVNIVKDPYDGGDKMTLWVSDFTENPNFFNHAYDPLASATSEGQDGDEYGYLNKFQSSTTISGGKWPGPFGQRSLQITCWGYHADAIRKYDLKLGSWIHIKNVHIKYGHNGGCLEGYLREDEGARQKVRIHVLDPRGNASGLDPHLREALRRKRDYEKAKKNDIKAVQEAANAGKKRKAALAMGLDGQEVANPKKNRKERRKLQRKQESAAEVQPAAGVVPGPRLNSAVKYEMYDVQPSSVEEITADKTFDIVDEGEKITITAPFVNLSYRGNFRVIDFLPERLDDFAAPDERNLEYADLTDDETGSESGASGAGIDPEQEKPYQWRFALKLEDAEVPPGQRRNSFWALVDNKAGQYLTNLDAVNLQQDPTTLEQLRETMFLFWGNLEEKKARTLEKEEAAAARARDGQPPGSSYDASGVVGTPSNVVSNRPFGCCIVEYGVKVREDDASKADAGPRHRWKRMFRLERTRIVKD